MQIRCSIHLGEVGKKLVLVSQETETLDHLALKLAGFMLFFDLNPMVGISSKNPAIANQEFRPDLIALNEGGEIKLWGECGNVATHKLDKLIRRNRNARIVVLKETVREAKNLREAFEKNDIQNSDRVEIYGEPSNHSFNLVANSVPFNFDFVRM